jgi:DeoR/GlpR family transcriptional regulator of sugar metabolism
MKAAFIKAAQSRILLLDSSKIGKVALAKVANLNEIDILITDKAAPPEEIEALRSQGLEVRLV